MAEAAETEEKPKKRRLAGILLSLVFALVGAAGGYGLAAMGLLPTGADHAEPIEIIGADDVVFVPLEPITISLSGARHLRFRADVEVPASVEADVRASLPRIVDALNSYLRAVELADLETPTALVRLRAQMLRRIRIVVGDGAVLDLLVSEFVLT